MFFEEQTNSPHLDLAHRNYQGNEIIWERIFDLLAAYYTTEHNKSLTARHENNGYTLLHYACVQGDRQTATARTKTLLEYCRKHLLAEEITAFVNTENLHDNTALQLAKETMNKPLIKLLLENGAQMQHLRKSKAVETDGLFDDVLLSIYDEAVEIPNKDTESKNRFAWEPHWDFRPVTCPSYNKTIETEKSNLNQTETLTLLLRDKTASIEKILQHPLARVFLHEKEKKFQFLLYMVMVYHMVWSAVIFVYIFCNTHILESTNIVNTTRDSNLTELCQSFRLFHGDSPTEFFSSWVFYFVLPLFISSIIKEVVEFWSCREKLYYILELGNLGQWLVNFTVLVVWLVNVVIRMNRKEGDAGSFLERSHYMWDIVLPLLYIFGMFASLLLVQVELGKIPLLGRQIEMFVFGFTKVATFVLAFLPLLTAFLFTFHLLLPMRPEFVPSWGVGFAKLLSMMTGEINYDELLYGDDEEDIAFGDVLKVFVLVFIVVIGILLQNLLIAISVSDGAKLEGMSEIHDLASKLEEIYLMENLLTKEWLVNMLDTLPPYKRWYRGWYERTFVVTKEDFERKYPTCKCEKCNRRWYEHVFALSDKGKREYPCRKGERRGKSRKGREFMRFAEYSKTLQKLIFEWSKKKEKDDGDTQTLLVN